MAAQTDREKLVKKSCVWTATAYASGALTLEITFLFVGFQMKMQQTLNTLN